MGVSSSALISPGWVIFLVTSRRSGFSTLTSTTSSPVAAGLVLFPEHPVERSSATRVHPHTSMPQLWSREEFMGLSPMLLAEPGQSPPHSGWGETLACHNRYSQDPRDRERRTWSRHLIASLQKATAR